MVQKPITSKPRYIDLQAKAKFTPNPPLPKEDKLKRLHASLVDQINDGYLENAIKSCRKILVLEPNALPAFKTLLFLLLQTDQYPEALAAFSTYNAEGVNGGDSFAFEKAYCLYRLHRGGEALQAIEKSLGEAGYESEEGRKIGHLKAQILYRAGEYEKVEEVYNDLLVVTPADSPESPDIENNQTSTQTHLEFHQSGYRAHIQTESEDQEIPALPVEVRKGADAADRGAVAGPSSGKNVKDVKVKKRSHKLPKGAKDGKPFEEDPDRWLPMALRRSYQAQLALQPGSGGKKKKGKQSAKEISGLGTQGSTNEASASGGAKGKKGKKGK